MVALWFVLLFIYVYVCVYITCIYRRAAVSVCICVCVCVCVCVYIYNIGERPLPIAATVGCLLSCGALVRGGAYVDALDFAGNSPLRLAKLYRHAHIIKYLRKKTNDTTWNLPLTGPESLDFPGWKPLPELARVLKSLSVFIGP